MKRQRLRLALLLAGLICATIAVACSGGGGTPQSGPPPAPTNVAASGGYLSSHLTWSTVSGATSYKVYLAATSGATPANPVTVGGPPYDQTGVTPWVPIWYRVSALIGSAETALSPPVSATPNNGFLIASRLDPGQPAVEVFESDVPGAAPLATITSGQIFGRIPGAGVLYGVACGAGGCTEVGVFTTGATRIVLANTPGHLYFYPDCVPANCTNAVSGRLIVEDDAVGAGTFDLLSFAANGTGQLDLKPGGCTSISKLLLFSKGLLFRCNGNTIYGSDALGPANQLTAAPTDLPVVTDGVSAILISAANRLSTQPITGGTPAGMTAFEVGDQADAVQGAVDSTALVMTQVAGKFNTYWMGFDGSAVHTVFGGGAGGITHFQGVTPDHSHALITIDLISAGVDQARLSKVHNVPGLDQVLTPAAASSSAAYLFPDGKTALLLDTGGWQLVSSTSGAVVKTVDTTVTDAYCGIVGGYAWIEQGAAMAGPLIAYAENGASQATFGGGTPDKVNCTGTQLASQVQPPGFGLLIDGAGAPWVVSPDLLTFSRKLETTSANGISWTGRGPGNRDSYAVQHVSGDYDTVLFDTTALTVTPVLTAPTSDYGFLSP